MRNGRDDYGTENELSNDAPHVVCKQVKKGDSSSALLLWVIVVLVGLLVLQVWSVSDRLENRLMRIEAAILMLQLR